MPTLDRAGRDDQRPGDLGVAAPGGQLTQYVGLANVSRLSLLGHAHVNCLGR
jgi:hypothetical protein